MESLLQSWFWSGLNGYLNTEPNRVFGALGNVQENVDFLKGKLQDVSILFWNLGGGGLYKSPKLQLNQYAFVYIHEKNTNKNIGSL